MEESEDILLKSLENSGIRIPPYVSSIRELKSSTLISICAQSLNLIEKMSSFPNFLPDSSVADQYKICMDIASGIKNLGYHGDLSFQQFLYPSEEDLYKLIRFLVEKLSESSELGRDVDGNYVDDGEKVKGYNSGCHLEDFTGSIEENGVDITFQKIEATLNDLRLMTSPGDASVSTFPNSSITPWKMDEMNVEGVSSSSTRQANNDGPSLTEDPPDNERDTSRISTTAALRDDEHFLMSGQQMPLPNEHSSKTEKVTHQDKLLVESSHVKISELQHLEEELQLLKAAVEMAFDDQHPIEFLLEKLNERLDTGKHQLSESKSQWEAAKKPLEMRKEGLEQSLYAENPEALEKLQKLRELELEKESILSEICNREDELSKLSKDLERQPKVASRKSYIERIKEITKNSKKQDADIERILKETRELQLESNSIQERLNRTYAVVDEMVFREAKRDPVAKQAYRLLTSIHDSFEQISEKILETDRIRRDVTEREKKLAAMAARHLDIDKLRADLDAIRKENETLEKAFNLK